MKLVAVLAAAFFGFLLVMTMSLAAALGGQAPTLGGPTAVPGIPPLYLQLYIAAGRDEGVDWAILAGIGKVETDHGRSTAPGVHSGVNAYGCCAGPMQFDFDTFKAYGKGDIYDPRDAIPAAARYLKAGGAPGDYHAAILTYNHSETYYRDVMTWAAKYRASAAAPTVGQEQSGPPSETWLAHVPGTTQECDARIVSNVLMIIQRFHATVTACYAASGHEASGEHPLGLAVDLVPTPPSSWSAMAELARFAGWRESCASTGCASQTRTAFRFVGWNGYVGHGDPAHAGGNAHLHLSWGHGPGRPARWVSIVAGE